MKAVIAFGTLLAALVVSPPGFAAGPQDQGAREAYKMILSQADVNKDGRLSAAECRAIWKDKSTAEKNCTFWDADKDGFITEAEYVKQASSLGKKR
jgi:Ca2+-binding EF-hand superfamily protein